MCALLILRFAPDNVLQRYLFVYVYVACILSDQNHSSLKVQIKVPLMEIRGMVKLTVIDPFHQMTVEFQLVVEQLGRFILLKAVFDEIVWCASRVILCRLTLSRFTCIGL